jgi:GT2 family glycosyltransferase
VPVSDAPRVSICIPAYARPTELREALESVVAQDFPDFEVVVGDDSGQLEPVARAVGDPRIRYFRNPERLGMAGNWNSVLDRSRGELIGLLMDDDQLLPGFVRKVVERFDRDPSLGVVFTNHFFDEGGKRSIRECGLPGGRHERFLVPLLRHKPVPVSAALMRREAWEQVRPLPDLQTSDIVMHARIAEAGWPFHYLDEPLMLYRIGHEQLSGRFGFRDEDVRAWELFEFEDPEAEELRRGYLARVLISRASVHLRRRRFKEAEADVLRAEELDPAALGRRGKAVRFLTRHPSLAPAALALLSRSGLIARG